MPLFLDEAHYLENRISSPQSYAYRARLWFLIDPEHPQTKRFYRSSYMYRTELTRHVKSDYWYTIHPFSRFRFYWDVWLAFYIYAILLVTPFVTTFAETLESKKYIYVVRGVIDVLAITEVVINCITGYSKDKYYRDIQLQPWKIFKNYFKGTFIVDLMFAIPDSLLIFQNHLPWLDTAINVVNYIQLLKLMSVRLIWDYLTHFFEV